MTFPYDQARLAGLVADVEARTAGLNQVVAQASQFRPRSSGLSEADLAEISRAAHGAKAPKELKDLARRVDAGEMTWQDVASGNAVGDEGVQRALATGLPDLQRAYTAIREGEDIEDVITSGTPRPGPDDDEPGGFSKDAW